MLTRSANRLKIGIIAPAPTYIRGAFGEIGKSMAEACKHPAVRVVSRTEDNEFVECVQCGEVFDSEEFEDMRIEESLNGEPDEDEN